MLNLYIDLIQIVADLIPQWEQIDKYVYQMADKYIKHYPNLEILDAGWNCGIGDEGIKNLINLDSL